MPGMNGTGPFGTGPIGRGMGPCKNRSFRWRDREFWPRRGAAWDFPPVTPSPDEEKKMLEQQKSWLENQLAAISQKLQETDKTQ